MPCYHPQTVYKRVPGPGISFCEIPNKTGISLEIPCGYCIGCRLERARQWSVRIMHEASMHEENSFVTMTYNDDNLPDDMSLNHEHVQKFMKRLRKQYNDRKVRYYVCGEYGDRYSRPHYHMCLFGMDFSHDRTKYSENGGNTLFNSVSLDNVWGMGDCQIGNLTIQSASYVARYVVDKQYKSDYEAVDSATGEIHMRMQPYCAMSLRPAIGKKWVEKYVNEVYVHGDGDCYADGRFHKPPRYYDRVAQDMGINIDHIKLKRVENASKMSDENTVERLEVREAVKKAAISQLKRTLK